ncbi:MAG: DMT family transporter [Burkholderiales bacterium]
MGSSLGRGGQPLQARTRWRVYLVLGLLNSALPFLLLSFAATRLSASLLSIMNAMAPVFAALVAAVWLRESLSLRALCGLLAGVCGVAILVGYDEHALQSKLAVGAALAGALCYGVASVYTKTIVNPPPPLAAAQGSMWAAALLAAPILPLTQSLPMPQASPGVWLATAALGIVSSGIAYLLYFRLIENVGATSALTVTFLIPVFGVLWGTVFLGEQPGWHTLTGSLVILAGTALVTGFSVQALLLPLRQ